MRLERIFGPIAPKRLQNLPSASRIVWVTDATCILTGQGWLYLVAVLDVCTRRIIGWAMHQILDARLVIATLHMALLQRRPRDSLIVHSDRGAQFASVAYRHILAQHRLVPSMSRKGNCDDNAFIESLREQPQIRSGLPPALRHLRRGSDRVFNYIETLYNRTRLHSSLAYRSPM